mgnify:CR=1 FL=1
MARDYSIKSSTVDPDKYVYRQERDLTKTDIDWTTVTKNLTTTIDTIRDNRETKKAEIETATTEAMNALAEMEQYDSESLNVKVLEGSQWGAEFLASQNSLMKRGYIKAGDFMVSKQKVSDSFSQLKTALGTFDEAYIEGQKRMNSEVPGEQSTSFEQGLLLRMGGLAGLSQWDFSGNPATGSMGFIKKGEDASNPANVMSLNVINQRLNQKSNYVSLSTSAADIVSTLGAEIEASFVTDGGKGSVITIEDWMTKKGSRGMLDSLVKQATATENKRLSILQDAGVTGEMYTSDPKVAADNPGDGTLANPGYVLMVPVEDGQGTMTVELTDLQKKLVDEEARKAIIGQLDRKEVVAKGHKKDAPIRKSEGDYTREEEQSSSFGYIDQSMAVISGDNTEFNSAASSLKTAWDKANPDNLMDENNPIDRSSDADFILINYADGSQEKIAKFKLDANKKQIKDADGNPIPVSDELLVQNLLTKVAPVTGSTQALMDEYLQENPGGLVDRGNRASKTSYQGTGDKVIEDTNLANKIIMANGEPAKVGDRLLAISQSDGSDEKQLAEYTAVLQSILGSELNGLTTDFEVSSEDITTGYGNRNFITVTIEGVPTKIEFDTVKDASKLQSEVQKAINAAKKKIRDKRSKSSTSNNSGGNVR